MGEYTPEDRQAYIDELRAYAKVWRVSEGAQHRAKQAGARK